MSKPPLCIPLGTRGLHHKVGPRRAQAPRCSWRKSFYAIAPPKKATPTGWHASLSSYTPPASPQPRLPPARWCATPDARETLHQVLLRLHHPRHRRETTTLRLTPPLCVIAKSR